MPKDILNSNFFELFDHAVSYDVDLNKIQQQYMELQKQVHPDRYANASDQEKRVSMQRTSWINEALSTLKDPVLRATYLLALKDLDVNLDNETTMDAAFLMQQLEMREKLENIRDEAEPLVVLDVMARDIKKSSLAMMQSFSQSYENDLLDDAREWIRKLQFMEKAKKQVNASIADIEDELLGS